MAQRRRVSRARLPYLESSESRLPRGGSFTGKCNATLKPRSIARLSSGFSAVIRVTLTRQMKNGCFNEPSAALAPVRLHPDTCMA